ncbi:MAG: DNA-directed RNA polymerase subunit alpha [Bacteroidales bacterium]|nr:DNA-directed RNA polymerase subunit alpha [Bacteroidales bacterium]
MAILHFQKPDRVIQLEQSESRGVFEMKPLEPGYGQTVGNALRRVLLSSLEGFAIVGVKFSNVLHEFSTIEGVVEDVVDIILNLKQVRIKRIIDGVNNETVNVVIHGQEVVTAGDIAKFFNAFEVANPDHVICHLEPKVKLNFSLDIAKGRGYVLAEDLAPANPPVGYIAMDAIFTPIRNVSYKIENVRVEQRTDYERLLLTVETDGTIDPATALQEAARILIQHFSLFTDGKFEVELLEKTNMIEEEEEDIAVMRKLLKTKLEDLHLSVRALNCLRAADIETLADLVVYNKSDLLKFRNFGKKSLTEIEELLKSKNLQFGMNISKYKLEKD